MECQCCNKPKPAVVRVCDVEDNSVAAQYHVCADCFTLVKRFLFDIARPLKPTEEVLEEVRTLLAGEGGAITPIEQPGGIVPSSGGKEQLNCPDCGMTLSEFRARGRFGCPRDYEVFQEQLDPLFERMHDVQPARHKGRLPAAGQDETPLARRHARLRELRESLQAAVKSEDFETAARLRDELAALEREAAESKAP
jgi:protein arginine kinase activator